MQPINQYQDFVFTSSPSRKQCDQCCKGIKKDEPFVQHQVQAVVRASSAIFHRFHLHCMFKAFQGSEQSIHRLSCLSCNVEANNTDKVFVGILSRGLKPSYFSVLNTFTFDGWRSALSSAMEENCLSALKELLSAAGDSAAFKRFNDPSIIKIIGAGLFVQAAQFKKMEILKYLLSLLKEGALAQEYKIQNGDKVETVETGPFAFEIAVKKNCSDVVRLLLESGVVPRIAKMGTPKLTNTRKWAFFIALEKSHLDTLTTLGALLKEGVILEEPGMVGRVIAYGLGLAQKKGQQHLVALLNTYTPASREKRALDPVSDEASKKARNA